ncbi:tail protein [Synechococcus phage S-WAM2]|uniref:Uncharacterized protein n=1 Tax=Synechococcus phage S-WAM2 TaxID=1815522 RepID=A0A1D8KT73_9CAUD|nr:tail protein [Synechococcus phage S-WAM2]AOV61890.1 hypothetical protein P29B0810_195 [Synechococcus phage S-WAM2]
MPLFTSELSYSDDYPTIEPSLKLDFANARALDPRITFERASTATYVGRDGLIKTAGEDEARFDHDPETGESLGLLIEESRTNRTTYSDYSTVTLQNVSTSSTVSTSAPDGSSIFAFEANNNTSVVHRIVLTNGNTGNATTPHVASFFIKIPPIGSDQLSSQNVIKLVVRWRSSAGSGTGAVIFYTHSTQQWGISQGVNAFGSTAPSKYDPTSAGAYFEQWNNGWVKFVFPGAISSNNSGETYNSYDWNISETSGEQGGNCTVFLWGAQFEQGAHPTSYIPTSGSTATRAVEYGYTSNMNFYNQSEGSVFSEVKLLDVGNTVGKVIWSFNQSGGFGEGIYMVNDNGSPNIAFNLFYGGSNLAAKITTNITTGTYYKTIYSFETNNVNLGYYGNIGTDDTSATLPTIERLVIGNNAWGGSVGGSNGLNPGNCHIKSFSYYPKRLTNTQLQTLTQ